MSIIGILPARMASTRYPGKPMKEICGMPMIGHVYHRARMSRVLDEVHVATCDEEIARYVRSIGGSAVMTKDTHVRCGDRVAEALEIIERTSDARVDIVVLIQGDEPLLHPDMIDDALAPMLQDERIQITCLLGAIRTDAEWRDPNLVKVVVDPSWDAIYFSRAPIPRGLEWDPSFPKWKQVPIMPHRRDFMLSFNRLSPTPLERVESVDLMRLVEHGHKVRMVPTEHEVQSVDTPADHARVEQIMARDPLRLRY